MQKRSPFEYLVAAMESHYSNEPAPSLLPKKRSQINQKSCVSQIPPRERLPVLQGVRDDLMNEPWSLKMGVQTLITMNKADCIRKCVFSHLAHHRGILSIYIRVAGLQIPSVYEE